MINRCISTSWWVILALWFTAAASPALTAVAAFSQLQEARVIMPEYADYLGDDPNSNGRMAAGFVTDPLFRVTDSAQAVFASLALILLVCARGKIYRCHSWLHTVNGILLALMIALTVWVCTSIAPHMQSLVEAYRTAAAANDEQQAMFKYKEMMVVHGIAEPIYASRAGILLIMIVISGILSSTPLSKSHAS